MCLCVYVFFVFTLSFFVFSTRTERPEVEVDFENQVKGYRYGQVRNVVMNAEPKLCVAAPT